MVSATATMGTGAKAVTCPTTTSASIDLATFSPTVPIPSAVTSAPVARATRATDTPVRTSTSAKILSLLANASKTLNAVIYPHIMSANVNLASKETEKSNAEISMSV